MISILHIIAVVNTSKIGAGSRPRSWRIGCGNFVDIDETPWLFPISKRPVCHLVLTWFSGLYDTLAVSRYCSLE
jgi:hypothetical protein